MWNDVKNGILCTKKKKLIHSHNTFQRWIYRLLNDVVNLSALEKIYLHTCRKLIWNGKTSSMSFVWIFRWRISTAGSNGNQVQFHISKCLCSVCLIALADRERERGEDSATEYECVHIYNGYYEFSVQVSRAYFGF